MTSEDILREFIEFGTYSKNLSKAVEKIEKLAIQQETERCAKIAEGQRIVEHITGSLSEEAWNTAVASVAKAIREGK